MDSETAYGTFKEGSAGSRINSENIRKYPLEETQPLDEYTPKYSDHPFITTPSPYKAATNTEQIRRQNARGRDHRKRWQVLVSPIAVDENSSGDKVANSNKSKKNT